MEGTINKLKEKILSISQNKPNKVYKYYPYNSHFIEAITNDYIWLSSPSHFNDPFESHINANFSVARKIDLIDSWDIFEDKEKNKKWHKRVENGEDTIEVLKNMIDELKDSNTKAFANAKLYACFESFCKMHIDLADTFKNMIDNAFKVGCLTTDPLSITMWSHYADSHNGVCIEYTLNENPYLKSKLYPVVYTETTLSFEEVLDNDFLPYILLLKGPEWTYEKEWRIISPGAENKFPAKASAVYLGAKATRNNDELLEVQKIAQQKSVDVIVTYKDQTKYALRKLSLFDKN